MSLELARLGDSVKIQAEHDGLWARSLSGVSLASRSTWPRDALATERGQTTALDIEQLLEQGLAEAVGMDVRVPYDNFESTEAFGVKITRAWTDWSPYLLRIDRTSDIGRSDFRYDYRFLSGVTPVAVERTGYYLWRAAVGKASRLDQQTYSVVQAMDDFNRRPSDLQTKEAAWLTFAHVKGCAREVGAVLDEVLEKNDVLVPSRLGVELRAEADGTLRFVPSCGDLQGEAFDQAVVRNSQVDGLYTVDVGDGRRVKVLLGPEQQEVLRRIKSAGRLKGQEGLKVASDPEQVFDGLLGVVDFHYGRRVSGVGEFQFAPIPKAPSDDAGMAGLWKNPPPDLAPEEPPVVRRKVHCRTPDDKSVELPLSDAEAPLLAKAIRQALDEGRDRVTFRGTPVAVDRELLELVENVDRSGQSGEQESSSGRYLLIYTDDEGLNAQDQEEAETSRNLAEPPVVEPALPASLRSPETLKVHQRDGVRWLQTCSMQPGRRGVLLADDMGMGKTLQVLTFLAWCIESDRFPDLSRSAAPFRPILIVVPPILLESRTWQEEMSRFFQDDGAIFLPVLSLHGKELKRLKSASGEREVAIGRPVLDLDELQRNRVVVTTYDTLKNYQHSFACLRPDQRSLWSVVVTDEAQEYKVPNTKISHALKALQPDFHIASTGTPVENRLLDLWNLFDALQPALLGTSKQFCDSYEGQPAIPADDNRPPLKALKERLLFGEPHAFLVRREKASSPDLPTKEEHRLLCDMSERDVAMHQSLLAGVHAAGAGGGGALAVLHRLSQLYQHPFLLEEPREWDARGALAESSKLRRVIEQLHLIRARGEKAIVFARYIAMQQMLASSFSSEFGIDVRIVNGETTRRLGAAPGSSSRAGILDAFRQQQGFSVLVLSPFVAGVGLTIVEANHVFHYGRWWNPAVEAQATDRVYRIGQTRDVHVYLPILRDVQGRLESSFDERLDSLLSRKQRLAQDFLRPIDSEAAAGEELLEALTGNRSVNNPEEALTAHDLGTLPAEQCDALLACLAEVEGSVASLASRSGNSAGATVLVRSRSAFEAQGGLFAKDRQRMDEGSWSEALAAIADSSQAFGRALNERVQAVLWSNEPATPNTRRAASELGVRLCDRPDLDRRLQAARIGRGAVLIRDRSRARGFQGMVDEVQSKRGESSTPRPHL